VVVVGEAAGAVPGPSSAAPIAGTNIAPASSAPASGAALLPLIT